MKKLWVFQVSFIILSIFPLLGFGQRFSLGGKIGIDFANLSNFSKVKSNYSEEDITVSRNLLIGYQFGIMSNFQINDLLSIETDLIMAQKGENLNITNNFNGMNGTTKISNTYLNLPILLKIGHSYGKFRITGFLGPNLGVALFGEVIYDIPPIDQTLKNKYGKGDFRRFDVGVILGVEPSFKLGPGNLLVHFQYEFGLLDINYPSTRPEGYFTRCNRNFGMSLGYLLPLGKSDYSRIVKEQTKKSNSKTTDSSKYLKGIKRFNFGFKFGTSILSGQLDTIYNPLFLCGVDFLIWSRSNFGGGIGLDIGYQKGKPTSKIIELSGSSYTANIESDIIFIHVTGSLFYRIKQAPVVIPYFGLGLSPGFISQHLNFSYDIPNNIQQWNNKQSKSSDENYFGLGIQPLAGLMFRTVPVYLELKYDLMFTLAKAEAYPNAAYGAFIITAGIKF